MRLPLAKLGAFAVILGTTLLTFVSCDNPLGPNPGIKGHNLLSNTAKIDGLDALAALGNEARTKTQLPGADQAPGTDQAPGMDQARGGPFFEGSYVWLHWLYIGILGMAAVSLLIPAGQRALAVLGVMGVAAIVLFINRFNAMLVAESDSPTKIVSFDWDAGAFAAAIGFALIFAGGFAPRE